MLRWFKELFGPGRNEINLEQQNRDLRESLDFEREQRKFFQDKYITLMEERAGQRSAAHNPISTKSESWAAQKNRLEREDRDRLAGVKKAYEESGKV